MNYTIYIRKKNWNKFQDEENKAELINTLLAKHYADGSSQVDSLGITRIKGADGLTTLILPDDEPSNKQLTIPEQLAELGLKYDPTISGQAYSEESQQYITYKVIDGEVIL